MTVLRKTLTEFFSGTAPIGAGQLVLAAFSGGPDSTALLAGLREISGAFGFRLHAAHVDHGLDPGSADRAEAAEASSAALDVPFHLLCPEDRPRPEESLEAAARRIRYGALEDLRTRLGARYIVTAHHRDDQAETVLLRMQFGSGLSGLESIRPVRGRLLRPLLDVSRRELVDAARRRCLAFSSDPTNRRLDRPRNLLRHRILPSLEAQTPNLRRRLAALAATGRRARQAWSRAILHHLAPRPVEGGWAIPLDTFRQLPPEVQALSLGLLHRLAGSPYPPSRAARRELLRQLEEDGRVGVDCGALLRWERRGKLLVLTPHATPTPFFSYNLQVPGEVRIGELGSSFRLLPVSEVGLPDSPRGPGSRMIPSGPLEVVQRALISQVLTVGDTVTVRNRRPGDMMRPPGARVPRPLKDLFTDRQVPLRSRDRQILVCAKGVIIWIPGFGVDTGFRPRPSGRPWLAEISADEQ